MSLQTTATARIKGSVGRRAALLADRIEEGAALLAAFAEGLSEEEWRAPVSDRDRRSVGLVVHHVASMYPIEMEVARAIASGKGRYGRHLGCRRQVECQTCPRACCGNQDNRSRTAASQ